MTLLTSEVMARRLGTLKLTDFPGIGPRMEQRLWRHGVWDTRRLLELTPAQMSRAWGSKVHGWRWWQLLRGEDVPAKPTRRQTVGHSHVLPPELRTDHGARGVLVRLIHKAAARMRDLGYWTGALGVSVRYEDVGRWDVGCHLPTCQDTLGLLRAFAVLWEGRPQGRPTQVSVVLAELVPARSATPSLFEDERKAGELSHVMDRINRLYGKNLIRFGTLCGSEHTAPTRIPFAQIPEFNPAFG